MGNPLRGDVHIDVALSNLSIAYKNAEYVGEMLMPVISVNKDSDKYFIYGKENLRTYRTHRAPGTVAQEVDWSVSNDSYSCEEHALAHPIPDEVRNDADAPLQIESDSTEMLTDMLALDHENAIATLALTSGSYVTGHTSALSGGDRWDDYEGSDPIENIRSAASLIHSKIGLPPNVVLMGKQVYDVIKNHPDIVARLNSNALKIVTPQLLAEIFGVDQVLVGSALKITSVEGAATEASSYVWGKNVIVARRGPAALKTISFGLVFRRNGYRQTQIDRESRRKTDIVTVADKTDEKIISTSAGFLFTTVIN